VKLFHTKKIALKEKNCRNPKNTFTIFEGLTSDYLISMLKLDIKIAKLNKRDFQQAKFFTTGIPNNLVS
jgi:hypothetical protein